MTTFRSAHCTAVMTPRRLLLSPLRRLSPVGRQVVAGPTTVDRLIVVYRARHDLIPGRLAVSPRPLEAIRRAVTTTGRPRHADIPRTKIRPPPDTTVVCPNGVFLTGPASVGK